jgi:hypothetical protein
MLVATLGEVHLRGAARTLGLGPSEVSKALASLERAGVLVSRLVGTTRFVLLNTRWYAASEMRALLERMAEVDPRLREIAETARTRPRRAGKPL